jgi:CheY-like chemotaxis protein
MLCDYNIPSYDGSSVMKQAQRAQPDVPVIFISGAMGDDPKPACLKIGAADCVLKYRLEQLAPAVKRALQSAAGRRLKVDRATSTPRCRPFMTHVPSAVAA